jgi:hypothetical protein
MNYDSVWMLSNVELGMSWVQSTINHGLWIMDLDATSGKLQWKLKLGNWDLKGVVDRLKLGGWSSKSYQNSDLIVDVVTCDSSSMIDHES